MGRSASNGIADTKKKGKAAPVETVEPTPPPMAVTLASTKPVQKAPAAPAAPAAPKAPAKKAAPAPAPKAAPPQAAQAAPAKAPSRPRAPKAATQALAVAAPNGMANGARSGPLEVDPGKIQDTYLQMDCQCEVCGRDIPTGHRVFGRVCRWTDGTRAWPEFRARCHGHGPDRENPIALPSAEDMVRLQAEAEERQRAELEAREEAEAQAEYAAIWEEAQEIGSAIEVAVNTALPPPEVPLRRMTAIFMAFSNAAAHMGLMLGWTVEAVAEHVTLVMNEQRAIIEEQVALQQQMEAQQAMQRGQLAPRT